MNKKIESLIRHLLSDEFQIANHLSHPNFWIVVTE